MGEYYTSIGLFSKDEGVFSIRVNAHRIGIWPTKEEAVAVWTAVVHGIGHREDEVGVERRIFSLYYAKNATHKGLFDATNGNYFSRVWNQSHG